LYPLVVMAISLGLLVVLLRFKVKIGLSMVFASVALALLLRVTPGQMWSQLTFEWNHKPFTQTTGYLFISITVLVLVVKVIGAIMYETGISQRLAPAMHGLFRSRRVALSVIPLIMGLLPTPGGIMLSAPMVREMGDGIGLDRSRQAAINFFFRHQWESCWPLYPAVPLIQDLLGVSVLTLIVHNITITLFGFVGGVIFLLTVGIRFRKSHQVYHARLHHNLRYFLHAFWPIILAVMLYTGLGIHPAVGILIAIFGLFVLHSMPIKKCLDIFSSANEPDHILLIAAALFFKLNLEASGSVLEIKDFLIGSNVPPATVIFFLPFIIAFVTGVTLPTVAITFPFLTAFIGTGAEAKMGLETLAFSGLICGLFLTPVHLCLMLSVGYFETSLLKIIAKIFLPVLFVAAAGITMAVLFG